MLQFVMSGRQKLINLTTILLAAYCLYILNSNIDQSHLTNKQYLNILKTIGNGQKIGEDMMAAIEKIANNPINKQNQKTPACFIKAFYQITVKYQISPKNLFALFEESNTQYDHVTNCSHYYTILLYRAQKLEEAVRNKIVPHLLLLQKQWIEQKYPKQGNNQKICVYLNSFNSEKDVKTRVTSLLTQSYENFLGVVQDDASTDNSAIFIDYVLNEIKKKNVHKNVNKQKMGLLKGLKYFINRCEDDSLVVILSDGDALLGDQALWIIDRIFSNIQESVVFFSSLSVPHANLDNISSPKQVLSLYNPFVVFKKEMAKNINFENEKFPLFNRNWLALELSKSASEVAVIKQGLIYRNGINNQTLLAQLSKMQKQFVNL